MYTVRVGSRRLPLYPLLIGCLGLLNIILLLAAVTIGIYCKYLKWLLLSYSMLLVIKENIGIYILRLNNGFV